MDPWPRTPVCLSVVLAVGLAAALCGIQWGLPGPGRFRALPPQLKGDAAAAQKLADAWQRLYAGIEQAHRNREGEPVMSVRGVQEFPAGWVFPPDALIGATRSTLLRSEHPDEQKTLAELSHMRPTLAGLKPIYAEYGGSYIYSLGAFFWLAGKLGLIKLVGGGPAYYLLHPEEMGRLFLAGRLFIVLFHLLTLCVVFDIGRRLGGDSAGLLGGLFFALCPVVIVQAHMLKPHPFAAFWALAAVRQAMIARESGRLRDFLLTGVFAGAGAGAVFFLFIFGALPLAAALGRRDPKIWRRAASGAVVSGVVFAAFNPFFLFSHADYAWEMSYQLARPADWAVAFVRFFGRPLAQAGAATLELAGGLALWRAWRAKDCPGAWRFAAAVFAAGAVVTTAMLARMLGGFVTGATAARFYYPFFGLGCALSGAWLAASPARRAARWALTAAVLLELSARGGVYLRNLAADDKPSSTRARAADWIDARIPAGAAVGLSRYPQPYSTPLFRYDRHRLVVFEDPSLISQARRPEFIVVNAEGRELLGQKAGRDYELAQSFLPEWTRLAPLADESFFANAPMYVYRRIWYNSTGL